MGGGACTALPRSEVRSRIHPKPRRLSHRLFRVNRSRERGDTHNGFLFPPRVLYGFPHGARIQRGSGSDSRSHFKLESAACCSLPKSGVSCGFVRGGTALECKVCVRAARTRPARSSARCSYTWSSSCCRCAPRTPSQHTRPSWLRAGYACATAGYVCA